MSELSIHAIRVVINNTRLEANGIIEACCNLARDQLQALLDDRIKLAKLAYSMGNLLMHYECSCSLSKCECGYDDVMDRFDVWQGVNHSDETW